MAHTVYGLRIKGEQEVRYVGLTFRTADNRLRQHLSAAQRNQSSAGLGKWLLENAKHIEAFRIAAAESREVAKATERLTIALCESLGLRLFNLQCMSEQVA